VIIFELACQPHLGLPISVVVLTAHFVGNRFSKNVYDVLMGKRVRHILYCSRIYAPSTVIFC
jgi:H+/Cl- antiporter ClcA